MKLLLLNGHGINFKVEKAKLHILDGRYEDDIKPKEYIFRPKNIDVDNIIVYGRSGDISIEAIRWLTKHNTTITILDWNGKLLTTIMPQESVQVKTKFSQYSAYKDYDLRLEIAQKIIKGKIERTKSVLEWLKLRYSINYDFSVEEDRLNNVVDVNEIIRIEARIARQYWREVSKIIPKKFEFEGRNTVDRPFGAGDYINCMLNYGYAILEAECLRAINSSGLDVHVGFLHEMQLGKNSLAYDLQEPFRFLIDLAVISAIEKKLMNKKDFIRTENYNLRLRPSGAKKIINEIQAQFNKQAQYKKKQYKWTQIMLLQTRELAHYLLGLKRKLDFNEVDYELNREDSDKLRKIILDIPYVKWKGLGFSKGTLHYMKQNAKSDKPFKLNKHVKERLLEISGF